MNLEPASSMLNLFQRDMTTLADSMYVWLTLNQKCFASVLETIQKRIRQSDVFNIVFKVAYYLDPRYHGERLSKRKLEEVRSHLNKTLSSEGQVSFNQRGGDA